MTADSEESDDTVSGDPARRRFAVIGAGITGLAAAHRLISAAASADSPGRESASRAKSGTDKNVSVRIYEASDRAGGIIHTENIDGFLVEFGPDSFITNKPGGVQLCEELGFTDELIPTDERYRRSLVLRKGKALPVPDGFMLMAPAKPLAVAMTPILSFSGKLRLLREALLPPRKNAGPDDDESLADFVRRRFGQEALDRLIQPLIGGIYTSDPEKLSLRATLPRFLDMEASHGSVIRATLAEQRRQRRSTTGAGDNRGAAVSGSGARYGLFVAPRSGLSSLIDRLTRALDDSGKVTVSYNTAVHRICRKQNDRSTVWQVTASDGTVNEFDGVIITSATHQIPQLLSGSEFSDLNAALTGIEYASSAIMVSAHRLQDMRHPADAFGLVIPACENRRILAVSFGSRKFTGRAPEGHVLLRTFIGGAMQPELMKHSDDELQQIADEELNDILGVSGTPLFRHLARYENSMPQYHVGHVQRVAEIQRLAAQHSGLQLAGSAYEGVGIPDSIASARKAADLLLKADMK